MKSLFALQRKKARGMGIAKPLGGAVAFVQRFGSALQLTPHFHVLVPEGVFEEVSGDSPVRFCALPPPEDEEVEKLLRKVALRVVKMLRKKGRLEGDAEDLDALDFLRSQAVRQLRLPLSGGDDRPLYAGRRCAFLEGFSLHANTWI